MTKILAIVIAVIMVIGIVPMTVSASDSTPEPPVNAYISEITDTTMTIAWTASSSESVVKNEIYDWDTGEVYGETSGTTYTVEGLNPNTKYYIAVWGITATGIESPSAIVSDTTRGSVTLYFKPNANWSQGDARFAAYVYDVESAWVDLTELESNAGYYSAVFPDIYTGILFCRMNPAKPENDWTNVWQQTVDLIIPTDGNNCLSHAEGSWNGGSGTWSYFEPTVAIETHQTASARVSASNPGLRFKTKIHKAYLEQLIEAYGAENVSVGTLITPADILGNKDFTHELGENGVAYIDVAASIGAPFGTDGDFNVYAGSIVNIKEGNLGRNFSAVGYIKIVDGDSVYYEYSESIATRNVSEIATDALEDTSAEYGEGYENKVSDGVYSPYTAAQREILEGLVAPTVIDTYDELQAAVNAGGNVTLGGNIDMGDSWLDIPEGVRVTLDLAGFTLSGSGMMVIDNLGTLTVSGGTVSTSGYSIINDGTLSINSGTYAKIDNRATLTVNGGSISGDYAIYFLSGTTKLVGNNFTLGYYYNAAIFWDSSDAKIDLSEYTGESLKIESREADMPLENIIRPEGWKLYDTEDNELVATVEFGTIVAKPAIAGGGDEEEEDTVIDTYEELQAAVNAGGNVTLGGNIDTGNYCLNIPEGVTVDLDLAGFSLSSLGNIVVSVSEGATLTVSNGTVSNSDNNTIDNSGTLTLTDVDVVGSYNNSIVNNSGQLTVNGGSVTNGSQNGRVSINANTNTNVTLTGDVKLTGYINYSITHNPLIDLSECTDEAVITVQSAAGGNLPLANITLPTGWKFYDDDGNEITEELGNGVITVKPAIAGGDGVIDTYEELQAALNAGGDVKLGGDINMGDSWITIPEGVTVDLDLAGFTLSGSGVIVIDNQGTLTVSGGTVSTSGYSISNYGTLTVNSGTYTRIDNSGTLTVNGGTISGGYAIYAYSGTTKLIGNNFTLIDDAPVYWSSSDAKIDLSEYTGESFKIEPALNNMPLENIILPEGFKLYDTEDNELVATVEFGTIVAKPEIAGGGDEEEEDTVIDTYEELQAAVNAGGNVTLGGDINMGDSWITIPEGVTVNLDLAGFSLSGSGIVVIDNLGTLTVSGGTVSNTLDSVAINNYGTLTVNGGTISSTLSSSAIDNHGTLTVNGGAISGNYAIWASAGTTKLVGNNFTLSGNYNSPVYWSSSDAKIDLSEYTGESFKIESSEADMPLENIILPEGWKLYDTSDNELAATVQWGTIVAKPADAQ